MASDIEESLTEMNNCMTLIMSDSLTFFSEELMAVSEKSTDVSTEHHTEVRDEQPCCSKDLNKQGRRIAEAGTADEMEESSGESEMDASVDEDVFIRSTGLMSHTYKLDLNVSSGGLSLLL